MKIRVGGIARDVVNGYIFYLGSRRRLRTIKQLRGGSLVIVANFSGPLSVSASDCNNLPDGLLTTKTTLASVSGGIGPFAYSWAIISGAATIDSPNSARTSFTKASFSEGDRITARATVTDALGKTATATMTATWYNSITPGV